MISFQPVHQAGKDGCPKVMRRQWADMPARGAEKGYKIRDVHHPGFLIKGYFFNWSGLSGFPTGWSIYGTVSRSLKLSSSSGYLYKGPGGFERIPFCRERAREQFGRPVYNVGPISNSLDSDFIA
jgi:hypothetical protein